MQEQRRVLRWEIDSHAGIRLPGLDESFYCKIDNINFKGIKLHLPQVLKKGDKLALEIDLGHGLDLKVEASVIWDRIQGSDNAYGFSFTRIRDIDKEKIYEFIWKNFPEQIKQHMFSPANLAA